MCIWSFVYGRVCDGVCIKSIYDHLCMGVCEMVSTLKVYMVICVWACV